MRIVVWNCNMALHKKMNALTRLAPDIAVLPEAAEPSRVPMQLAEAVQHSYHWIGENPSKGLGAMASAPFELEPACPPDRNLEWVLPLRVRGPVNFNLLAIWAMNHRASPLAMGPNRDLQIQGALETYPDLFDQGPIVLAGDLNDNVTWDKPRGARPFATKVDLLRERGLVSAYHEVLGIEFGQEPDPTIYWRDRKVDGPRYHIDFCFLPESWIPYTSVAVGSFSEWVAPKYSDHVPLIIDVMLPS